MIKLVEHNDIDRVMQIVDEAKALLKTESMQWQQGYPNIAIMTEDINNKRLYGYYNDDNVLCGFVALMYGSDPTYQNIEGKWNYPSTENDLVIHRLAVGKDYHGMKIGEKLVKFAISEAIRNNKVSVKIDTHKNNIAVTKIAINNGFQQMGVICIGRGEVDNLRNAFELDLKH